MTCKRRCNRLNARASTFKDIRHTKRHCPERLFESFLSPSWLRQRSLNLKDNGLQHFSENSALTGDSQKDNLGPWMHDCLNLNGVNYMKINCNFIERYLPRIGAKVESRSHTLTAGSAVCAQHCWMPQRIQDGCQIQAAPQDFERLNCLTFVRKRMIRFKSPLRDIHDMRHR